MPLHNVGGRSRRGNSPSRCIIRPPCPEDAVCPTGPRPPIHPTAAIPFSASQYGMELGTDAEGNPQIIWFSGFGETQNSMPIYLQPGDWAGGRITIGPTSPFGSAFIMPYSATLRDIHVLFSSKQDIFINPGVTLYPFVCLATSNSAALVYTVLQNTITTTDPYIGGVTYPKHTLRRGALTNLNVSIPEGTLVAIVAGIRGVNVTEEQNAGFTLAGGLYLE